MIYINQSINLYLAAHLSISSRQKKVFIASSSVKGKQAMRAKGSAVKKTNAGKYQAERIGSHVLSSTH